MLPAGIGADYKEQEKYFASQEYKNRSKAGISRKEIATSKSIVISSCSKS